jgi:putative ATP-dependent endonuclease of OLD family
MYIAEIHIQNYRCFEDMKIEFSPRLNVIIGENNAGKTAVIRALGLIFDRKNRHMNIYDFYQGLDYFDKPPSITISVTLRSSENDGLADKALVATWLTKLDTPWEATLTYQFFMPEEEWGNFENEIGPSPNKKLFWNIVDRYLPKYTSRIYGGKLDAQVRAEPEALKKFDYQFLDAIRDVESELFSGTNPLLKSMLQEVLDRDLEDNPDKILKENNRRDKFSQDSNALMNQLTRRIDHDTLFSLVEETGAKDGGEPTLSGHIDENDLIAALQLFVQRESFSLPANFNGLGYNNLIYISLVLSSLDFNTSVERRGQENAVIFPMLLIEEPEAHLHPALQYKLLKYIQKRIEKAESCRQVFITTHSTHITSAAGLDPIICLSAPDRLHKAQVSYPARVFEDTEDEESKSKKYVERYLDATKSTMLFSKAVIFVEGITELLLIPCLSKYVDSLNELDNPIEDKHVAVIAVGGVNFKHFLPIFGAGLPSDRLQYALRRRVACIVDADPTRKRKESGARWQSCWPYQLGLEEERYEYQETSGVLKNLHELIENDEVLNISIYHGAKTFEYDLAYCNSESDVLISETCRHKNALGDFIREPADEHEELEGLLKLKKVDDDTADSLESINKQDEKQKNLFATYYLLCVTGAKGEHAFDLESELRKDLKRPESKREFHLPDHIAQAIEWACRADLGEE